MREFMKLKYILLYIVSIVLLVTATGCSDGHSQNSFTITNKSKAVLIPGGKGGRNLTLYVVVKNNTSKKSDPLYVEFDVKDKCLSTQMKNNKFIIGQGLLVINCMVSYSL